MWKAPKFYFKLNYQKSCKIRNQNGEFLFKNDKFQNRNF